MSNRLLVGRYELIEKIGEGGMASVYKAKDRLLNRYVAIKVLRPEFTKDAEFINNFRKESQAAAGLSHNNIVNVYDVGHEGNIHFIVMELVEGKPLSEIIKAKAPMEYKEVVNIAKQIGQALDIAHKHGIIHRDVKPHNILITSDGTAKLADFGIAKAINNSTLSNKNDKILGSVHYFSPEQARGSYVDERSDLYSLGIVMYEMLTAQVPFDGDSAVSVALMHINNEMPRPTRLVPAIPPAVERIVMKCTEKVQTNRYKNAEELLDDLNSIQFLSDKVGKSVYIANEDDDELQKYREARERQLQADKENEEDFSPKSKKKFFIIYGAIAFIGIVIALLAIFGVFDSKEALLVPDLSNKTFEQASKELEQLGLTIEQGEAVFDEEIEEGKIVSQNPEEGTEVEEGAVVTVILSKGKEEFAVPNLYGHSLTEAKEALRAVNLELGDVKYEYSDKEADTVISQSVEAGSTLTKGSSVDIVISKGEEIINVPVPNLTGISLGDAKTALKDAGLKLGKVSYEFSDTYKKGYVTYQEYAANQKVNKGTSVAITVSKGAKPVDPEPVDPEGKEGEDIDDL
ncbi:MAG: Stk1 family PASTA domain-containing Ser/Thr kinase [Clostridia bacterium]|nr:Stk1 family PASTA domain-containing Ser/Thr kinase [Clostridia bacterium]